MFHARLGAALVAAALLLSAPAGHASATPQCETADLAATLVGRSPGAGQRYATLRLTNVSDGICRLRGYPDAQLERDGDDLLTDVARSPAKAHTVTLPPGARAVSLWRWTAVASGDEPTSGVCAPTADHVRITAPGTSRAQRIRWRFGVVCGHGRIRVDPMRASG